MSPASQDLHLPHAALSPDGQDGRLESEEPVGDAPPDLHGSRAACDGARPPAGTLRLAGDLHRPFSTAHDRPRARLPDLAADLHPLRSASCFLITAGFDRLPLPRGLA